MNSFSQYRVICQENSLRCKTWSLALSNLFNSRFSVVSSLFVLGPPIHFTCGWFIQSLWPLKLCLLLSQHDNLLLFIWKEMSAQLSSWSLHSRCSPCTSVFCGLSVNANNGDLDRCITGKAGSLNVMVSFPPETKCQNYSFTNYTHHALMIFKHILLFFFAMLLKSTKQEKHLKWSFCSTEKHTLYSGWNMPVKHRKSICFYPQDWVKDRFWRRPGAICSKLY